MSSDSGQNCEEKVSRGRGRPRKNDTKEYKPSPVVDRNKRVVKLL
jgi:hypothetical protein